MCAVTADAAGMNIGAAGGIGTIGILVPVETESFAVACDKCKPSFVVADEAGNGFAGESGSC